MHIHVVMRASDCEDLNRYFSILRNGVDEALPPSRLQLDCERLEE
jgi:hypothetical protein